MRHTCTSYLIECGVLGNVCFFLGPSTTSLETVGICSTLSCIMTAVEERTVGRHNLSMKKLVLFLSAVVGAMMISFEANAQNQEILRLKDGTEIVGVVERLPNGGARVTDINGDIFVFTADEILLITNEEQKAKEIKKINKSQRGYFGLVEAGFGSTIDGYVLTTINMINGYKFSPKFYLGIGIGIGYETASVALPIYLNMRYSILGGRPGKVSPYVSLSAGYDVWCQAVILEPSAGIQIKTRNKNSWWFAFDVPFYFDYDTYLGIKVGWSF